MFKCLCDVHKFSDNSDGDYWSFIRSLRHHHLCWSRMALQVVLSIGRVCLCHGQHAIGDRRYFLGLCDNKPPARPARIPLGNTLCGYRTVVSGFQRPVGRRSYQCVVEHYSDWRHKPQSRVIITTVLSSSQFFT